MLEIPNPISQDDPLSFPLWHVLIPSRKFMKKTWWQSKAFIWRNFKSLFSCIVFMLLLYNEMKQLRKLGWWLQMRKLDTSYRTRVTWSCINRLNQIALKASKINVMTNALNSSMPSDSFRLNEASPYIHIYACRNTLGKDSQGQQRQQLPLKSNRSTLVFFNGKKPSIIRIVTIAFVCFTLFITGH